MDQNTVGLVASIVTVIYTGIGLPDQIRKIALKQSTEGLSLPMNVLVLFAFSIWAWYGVLDRNWYIILPNSLGTLGTIVILGQFYYFRPGVRHSSRS